MLGGVRSAPEHAGDRFGRVRLNSWIMPTKYSATGTWPAVWQERYSYDIGGRRTSRHQVRTNESRDGLDWNIDFDRLNRVVTAWKGTWRANGSGGVFTRRPSSQQWSLDELGHWTRYVLDSDNNGTFGGGSGVTDSENRRTHSSANELTTYQTQSSNNWSLGTLPSNRRTVGYDGAGNLRATRRGGTQANFSDASILSERYTVDAWNRITRKETVTFGEGVYQINYTYNGLGWLVKEHQKDVSSAPDKRRWIYYSPSWQPIVELEDWSPESGAPAPSVERKSEQFWGLRNVNDAVLRRCDTDLNGVWNSADETAGGGAFYQLTDSLFSVVAHIRASDGSVACRFSYDAYGRVRVHLPSDFNGDGVVNATDLGDTLDPGHGFLGAYAAGKPPADINGDGEVNADDESEFSKSYDADAERSTSGPGAWGPCVLRIGFCGYVQDFNYQTHWLARNRWYESDQGRWLTRDPAGYIDGLSMYMYVRCNPFGLVDPMGLAADGAEYRARQRERQSSERGTVLSKEERAAVDAVGSAVGKAWGVAQDLAPHQTGALKAVGGMAQGMVSFTSGLVTDPVSTATSLPRNMKTGFEDSIKRVLSAGFGEDGHGRKLNPRERVEMGAEGVTELLPNLLGIKVLGRGMRAPAAAPAAAGEGAGAATETVVAGETGAAVSGAKGASPAPTANGGSAAARTSIKNVAKTANPISRPFADRLTDYQQNPGRWKPESVHAEPGASVRSRGGASEQIIYRNTETGETIVRHRVTNSQGKVLEDHFRPGYKPRMDEVEP